MAIPAKELRKYVKRAVNMWATRVVAPEAGLTDLADTVEYSCPFERYTGGYNEVYIGAATLIRKLVKASVQKGAKS